MNILQFIETGGAGGAERVVLELSKGLISRGHNVQVVTLRKGWLSDNLMHENIKVTQIESLRSMDLALIRKLANYLRKNRIEILHSHLFDSNLYASIASRLAGVPHLATEHGDIHHPKGKSLLRIKLRIQSLFKSQFACVSQFTADSLVALGISRDHIEVIPNPTGPAPADDGEMRRNYREQLGLPADAKSHWLWVHVANLRPVKDQSTLIRGFARSLELSSHPQTLCVVGDGPERSMLERLVDELALTNAVKFLGHRDDVWAWLKAGDGFVLSSISEAMPMSLLEAASSKLLLIVSAVGGMVEVVADGCGYTFTPGNVSELGEKMAQAVIQQEISRSLAERAYERIVNNFSSDRVIDLYLEKYLKIASR